MPHLGHAIEESNGSVVFWERSGTLLIQGADKCAFELQRFFADKCNLCAQSPEPKPGVSWEQLPDLIGNAVRARGFATCLTAHSKFGIDQGGQSRRTGGASALPPRSSSSVYLLFRDSLCTFLGPELLLKRRIYVVAASGMDSTPFGTASRSPTQVYDSVSRLTISVPSFGGTFQEKCEMMDLIGLGLRVGMPCKNLSMTRNSSDMQSRVPAMNAVVRVKRATLPSGEDGLNSQHVVLPTKEGVWADPVASVRNETKGDAPGTAAHESNPALIQMAQVMVPDLKKIWGFEPTRDHLKGLLAMK
ncbi:unnamed protein product, partial [Symbiodinium sp. KB8]